MSVTSYPDTCGISLRPIIPYPTGRFVRGTLSQALRAWLRSACPSGQNHSPIEGHPIKLALMGFNLGYAFMALQGPRRCPSRLRLRTLTLFGPDHDLNSPVELLFIH